MSVVVQIYNAATMSSTPVAMVKLPGRVPVGLHGTFITSEEFLSQQEESQELQEAKQRHTLAVFSLLILRKLQTLYVLHHNINKSTLQTGAHIQMLL